MLRKIYSALKVFVATIFTVILVLIHDASATIRNCFGAEKKQLYKVISSEERMFKWSTFTRVFRSKWKQFNKIAIQGQKAIDADLWKLNGNKCKLLSFMNEGRPLVLIFGSCT